MVAALDDAEAAAAATQAASRSAKLTRAAIRRFNARKRRASSGSTCLMEGFAFKRGGLVRSWKRRWFNLDAKRGGVLTYADSPEDFIRGEFKGVIHLRSVSKIQSRSSARRASARCEGMTRSTSTAAARRRSAAGSRSGPEGRSQP